MALILLTYVLLGEVLTAEKAFLTLALFNVVRLSMTLFFPLCIQLVSEALISVSRIQKFIEMEELDQISTSTVISQSFEGKFLVLTTKHRRCLSYKVTQC